MVGGLSGYQRMQRLLVQQRLWAREHGSAEVSAQFEAVSRAAAKLQRVFEGYCKVMELLAALDELRGAQLEPEEESSTGKSSGDDSRMR